VLVIRNNCKKVIVCICVSDRDELTQTCSVGSDKLSICEGPFVHASDLGIGAKRGARFANEKA